MLKTVTLKDNTHVLVMSGQVLTWYEIHVYRCDMWGNPASWDLLDYYKCKRPEQWPAMDEAMTDKWSNMNHIQDGLKVYGELDIYKYMNKNKENDA